MKLFYNNRVHLESASTSVPELNRAPASVPSGRFEMEVFRNAHITRSAQLSLIQLHTSHSGLLRIPLGVKEKSPES